jgi:hypothetical protein
MSSDVDRAVDFLRGHLAAGPVASKEISAKAEAAGLSWPAVRRAQDKLGIKPTRRSESGTGSGAWFWSLPKNGAAAAEIDPALSPNPNVDAARPTDLPEFIRLIRAADAEGGLVSIDEVVARDVFVRATSGARKAGQIVVRRGAGEELRGVSYLRFEQPWCGGPFHLAQIFQFVDPQHRSPKIADELTSHARYIAARCDVAFVANTSTLIQKAPVVSELPTAAPSPVSASAAVTDNDSPVVNPTPAVAGLAAAALDNPAIGGA